MLGPMNKLGEGVTWVTASVGEPIAIVGSGFVGGPAMLPVAPVRMPRRRRPSLRQTDVKRALKAAQKAAVPVAAVRIEPDGAITLVPGAPPAEPVPESNPWDDL